MLKHKKEYRNSFFKHLGYYYENGRVVIVTVYGRHFMDLNFLENYDFIVDAENKDVSDFESERYEQ